MRKTVKNVAMVTVLLSAVLIIMGSCRNGAATAPVASEKEEMAMRVEITPAAEGTGYAKVAPVVVHRGGQVVFTNPKGTLYLLFPNPDLKQVADGIEKPAKDGFLAFEVGPGAEGVLKVPAGFPNPGRDVRIQYSVLTCEGSGEQRQCEYVEGASPPWIIVPPVP